MAMEDILPAVMIIAVVWLAIRWLTGSRARATGDGIPGVTPSMVDTVHSAFPDVPLPNVIYHLSKTKSTQATSEEIIERGFLPAPPAAFQIPPSLLPTTVNPLSGPSPAPASSSGSASFPKSFPTPPQSLIERYNLSTRVPSESATGTVEDPFQSSPAGVVGGKWEDTKEKRERELRERKERMILEARRRLLDKQAKERAA